MKIRAVDRAVEPSIIKCHVLPLQPDVGDDKGRIHNLCYNAEFSLLAVIPTLYAHVTLQNPRGHKRHLKPGVLVRVNVRFVAERQGALTGMFLYASKGQVKRDT